MKGVFGVTVTVACLISMTTSAVVAPSPGAASASTVKLPDGPGSVRGLVDLGSASLFTGQISFSVPIPLPPGRGGSGPSVALTYSGGLGNGPVGVGWTLGLPIIRRSTRHGVPTFTAQDEIELEGLAASRRLFPIGGGHFALEGAGRAVDIEETAEGFVARQSDGARLDFDVPQAEGDRATAWALSQTTSALGEVVRYDWSAHLGQLYLIAIHWGPERPGGSTRYRATFQYASRPDAFTSYREGFRVITAQRLERVVVTVDGVERNDLNLVYADERLDAPEMPLSRLAEVRLTGMGGDLEAPRTRFFYGGAFQPRFYMPTELNGFLPGQRGVTPLDVDGDGLTDLVRFELGAREWRRNRGTFGGSWLFEAARPLPGGDLRHLDDIRLMDLTGDGRAELVYLVGREWVVYQLAAGPSQDGLGWHFERLSAEWPGATDIPLHDPRVAFGDLNGDGRTDVLAALGSDLRVAFGQAVGLGALHRVPEAEGAGAAIVPGDSRVELLDVNGDGLDDLAFWGVRSLLTLPGRGDGTFAAATHLSYPSGWELTGAETLRLQDLNRDGLVDLVHVGQFHVSLYSGNGKGFSDLPTARLSTPKGQRPDDVVSFGDMTGNGSIDVLWSTADGLYALDLVGTATQAMITGMANGLGAQQEWLYRSTAAMAQEAERDGESWLTFPKGAQPVPWKQVVRTGRPDEPARVTVYKVRDGAWDDAERRFAGYRLGLATSLADDDRPSEQVVVETEYELGLGASRVLRGRPLRLRTVDGLGRMLNEVVSVWDAVPVDGLPDEVPELRVPVVLEELTFVHEGEDEPLVTRTVHTYDSLGRDVRTEQEGRLDLTGDEVVTETAYASSEETGVRDVVCAKRVRAGVAGPVLAYERSQYDVRTAVDAGCDPAAEAMCACTVAEGLVVAKDAWLGPVDGAPGRWVRQSEVDHDSHGNPVRVLEGGVERTFAYDSDALHPIEERIGLPLLAVTAEWDPVLDTVAALTDPSGVRTRVEYDGLGRPVRRYGPDAAGVERLLLEYGYVTEPASGTSPGPQVRTTRFEEPLAPNGESVTVLNGLGEPHFTATYVGALGTTEGPWVVSAYRAKNRLGLTSQLWSPFATLLDPRQTAIPPPGESVPSQTLVYDALRRLVEQRLPATESLPDGVVKTLAIRRFEVETGMSWRYQGPSGAPVARSGAVEVAQSDGLGRVVHTVRTVPDATEPVETRDSVYDAAGRLVEERLQGDRVVRTAVTDTLGRVRRVNDPDFGFKAWEWDDAGRVVATENAVGDRIDYSYDAAGRLVGRQLVSDAVEEASVWRYDTPLPGCNAGVGGAGRLLGVTLDRVGLGRLETVCSTYDAAGRESRSEHTILGKTLATQPMYSLSGQSLGVAFEDDSGVRLTLAQAMDAAGRLARIDATPAGESAQLLWAATGYDARGGLHAEQFGSGVVAGYGYDALGLVSRVRVGATGVEATQSGAAAADLEAALWALPPPSVRLDLAVRYDGHGAPADVADLLPGAGLDRTAHYAYDAAGRIVGATLGSGVGAPSFEYRYDALQNLTRRALASGSAPPGLVARLGNYGHGGTAHPRRLVDAAGLTLGYDAAGRAVTYGSTDVAFDADDRVTEVAPSGASTLGYAYGADGERIANWVGGALEERRYGPGFLHKPLSGELEVVVTLGDRPVARLVLPDDAASTSALEVRYLHKGVSAGPVLVTGADGELLEERVYEPYGALLALEGSGEEPYGWLNKPVDPNTLWTDHGARWYAPEVARWMSSDPLSWQMPMEQLPYGYVGGAPTRLWDPDGHGEAVSSTLWTVLEVVAGATPAGRAIRVASILLRALDLLTAEAPAPGPRARAYAKFDRGTLVRKHHWTARELAQAPSWFASAMSATADGETEDSSPVVEASKGGERNPAQDKKLTHGEAKRLEKGGEHPHSLKPKKDGSKYDLFKDKDGTIYVKPKDGRGPGDPTGLNINDF